MWASRVKAWWRPPIASQVLWGPQERELGSGALRVKAHCCLRCTAYACREPPCAQPGTAPSRHPHRLQMWGSPFGNGSSPPVWAPRPRVGSAGSCTQPEVARPPGADAAGARGAGGRTRAAFTGLVPPALLSPELWAVASARERSVLWKEERKCKRCWAGGKAQRLWARPEVWVGCA